MSQLTHGSLFAGIGGFDLGFERAGMKTIWQVEIDEYCRRVLAKHFPDAERFNDVRECGAANLKRVDVLSGGFPCQDISNAGKGAGIAEGTRSGLWIEYFRIIRELRPRFVVVENVSALLVRGIGRVLGDLAEGGYDAEWDCIRAYDVGAPHLRDRIWIVAYSDRGGRPKSDVQRQFPRRTKTIGARKDIPEAAGFGQSRPRVFVDSGHQAEDSEGQTSQSLDVCFRDQWAVEPNVGRVANGIPARVDRLKGLGNAIVPQIAEWIGRRIVESIGGR